MRKFITIIDMYGGRILIRKDSIDRVEYGVNEYGNRNIVLVSNNNKIGLPEEYTFEQILKQLEDEND